MEADAKTLPELPFVTANARHRFAGEMLSAGLIICTLGIGYLIWMLISWGKGQNPSHQVLKMRVYSIDTGKPVRWRHMALRCFLVPFTALIIPNILTRMGHLKVTTIQVATATGSMPQLHVTSDHLGLYLTGVVLTYGLFLLDGLWIFRGTKRQRLTDVVVRTVVLNECVENPLYALAGEIDSIEE